MPEYIPPPPGTRDAPTEAPVAKDTRYTPHLLNFQCPHCSRKLAAWALMVHPCMCGNWLKLVDPDQPQAETIVLPPELPPDAPRP